VARVMAVRSSIAADAECTGCADSTRLNSGGTGRPSLSATEFNRSREPSPEPLAFLAVS
jgi:hypothetical protein